MIRYISYSEFYNSFLTPTVSAWPCAVIRKLVLWETLFLDQLHGFSILKNFRRPIFINQQLFKTQAPVAQKIVDEVVFQRFQGERVEFLESNLIDTTQIFHAHLLENTDFSPSRFHFSVSFIRTNEIDPQFFAQRARDGVNRSGTWGLSKVNDNTNSVVNI